MSLIEDLGFPDPFKIAREFKAENPQTESTDPVLHPAVDRMAEIAKARIAPLMHDALSRHASSDPAILAMADQMHAEFRDTRVRGHQPVC